MSRYEALGNAIESAVRKACEGKVVFTTNHFSTYAIVFEDVSRQGSSSVSLNNH